MRTPHSSLGSSLQIMLKSGIILSLQYFTRDSHEGKSRSFCRELFTLLQMENEDDVSLLDKLPPLQLSKTCPFGCQPNAVICSKSFPAHYQLPSLNPLPYLCKPLVMGVCDPNQYELKVCFFLFAGGWG